MIISAQSSWGVLAVLLLVSGCGDPPVHASLTIDVSADFATLAGDATVDVAAVIYHNKSSFSFSEGSSTDWAPMDPGDIDLKVGPSGSPSKLTFDAGLGRRSVVGYAENWDISAEVGGTSYVGKMAKSVPWPAPALSPTSIHVNQPATLTWTPVPVSNGVMDDFNFNKIQVVVLPTNAVIFDPASMDNGSQEIPADVFAMSGSYEIRLEKDIRVPLQIDPQLEGNAELKFVLTTQVEVSP